MRVAVLSGGMSREREVSLRTGKAVLDALGKLGHESVSIDPGHGIARDIINAAADVAFIALHGRFGEDGTMQGLLEILGMPYTGSGVLASAAAMDKIFSKRIFRSFNLPTPEFLSVDLRVGGPESLTEEMLHVAFPPPYVVKPAREGSSLGLTIVDDRTRLRDAVLTAALHDKSILVEQLIEGMEITVGIIGTKNPEPLPPIEIVPRSGRYDYASKYTVGATEYIIPPRMESSTIADCQAIALAAHKALGCSGVSRVDLIVGADGIEILEVNTIPGMTETSLLPKAARAHGLAFHELIDKIIHWGLEAR